MANRQTDAPGDGLRLAAGAAREGNDLVVAVGGDGTLGEVAAGLAGSGCILGVLPVGTGNVWARNLRIPHWTPSSRTACGSCIAATATAISPLG